MIRKIKAYEILLVFFDIRVFKQIEFELILIQRCQLVEFFVPVQIPS